MISTNNMSVRQDQKSKPEQKKTRAKKPAAQALSVWFNLGHTYFKLNAGSFKQRRVTRELTAEDLQWKSSALGTVSKCWSKFKVHVFCCQDEPETGANLKTIYWKHINEAKERILQENPELTKREALRKAQSES